MSIEITHPSSDQIREIITGRDPRQLIILPMGVGNFGNYSLADGLINRSDQLVVAEMPPSSIIQNPEIDMNMPMILRVSSLGDLESVEGLAAACVVSDDSLRIDSELEFALSSIELPIIIENGSDGGFHSELSTRGDVALSLIGSNTSRNIIGKPIAELKYSLPDANILIGAYVGEGPSRLVDLADIDDIAEQSDYLKGNMRGIRIHNPSVW